MYFTKEQLINFGFSKIGKNCKISKKTSFYNVSGSIGNNVRIDDDVILKGNITLSSHVHLARG
jgi:galactoside O-acetyltransferase